MKDALPGHWLRRLLVMVAALVLSSMACSALGGSSLEPAEPGVLFTDDFSDSDSGWGHSTDATGSLEYEGGQYVFKVTEDFYLTWGNLVDRQFENIRVEVEVENKSRTDEPTFGVICHSQDDGNFYYAGFGSDGYYAIIRMVNEADTILTDPNENKWIFSEDITLNASQYRLAVQCAGGEISLMVDDKTIATVQDSTFTRGEIGLFVLTFDEPEADVRFDNLRVVEVK